MIRKLGVVFGIASLIIVVLVAGAAVALRLAMPPSRVRSLTAMELERYFKRQVEVGDISVGIFSGLRVNGIQVSESPDFKAGTFLRTGEITTQLRPAELLRGDVTVTRLRFTGSHLSIVRLPDGSFNFTDILQRSPAGRTLPSPQPAKPRMAAAVSLSDILVENAGIDYVDRTKLGISAVLEGIRMDVVNLALEKRLVVKSDFTLNLLLREAKFIGKADLAADIDLGKGRVKVTGIRINSGSGDLTLSGTVVQTGRVPVLDMDLVIDKGFLSDILKQFSASLWFQLKFLADKPISFRVTGPLDKLDVKLVFDKAA